MINLLNRNEDNRRLRELILKNDITFFFLRMAKKVVNATLLSLFEPSANICNELCRSDLNIQCQNAKKPYWIRKIIFR